jgi:hypothetical protein
MRSRLAFPRADYDGRDRAIRLPVCFREIRTAARNAVCSCHDMPGPARIACRSWNHSRGRAKRLPHSCNYVPGPIKRSRCHTPDIREASPPFPRTSLDVTGGARPFPPPILDVRNPPGNLTAPSLDIETGPTDFPRPILDFPTGAKLSPAPRWDVSTGARNVAPWQYSRETVPFYARSTSWRRPTPPNAPGKIFRVSRFTD